MNPADRLQARSLLLDELYLRATRAEHERDQARSENEELKAKLGESENENAVLRGEPNPA